MRIFLTGVMLFSLAATGCNESSSRGPTTPTAPLPPPIDSVSLQGRWEGSYLYARTEPANCPIVGLPGPSACPVTPVPITLTLSQSGNTVSGELTGSIFGGPGATTPFSLRGQLSDPSTLVLTGEQLSSDASCRHEAMMRMVSFTLRRTTAKSLEGEFHFDGDRRSSSCFFFDVQVYARDVRLMHVAP